MVAVVTMVGVSVAVPKPQVLGSFDDPVRRGVYGPWHPTIRTQASQAFLRHHVFAGGLDSNVVRTRARMGEMTAAKA